MTRRVLDYSSPVTESRRIDPRENPIAWIVVVAILIVIGWWAVDLLSGLAFRVY